MATSRQARDPAPLSQHGELALVVLSLAAFVCGWCVLGGISLVTFLASGTWIWPADTATVVQVVGGLLTGDTHRGWPQNQAGVLPGQALIYTGAVTGLIGASTIAATTAVLINRFHLPNDPRRGLATRRETAQVLGLSRLRQVAPIIRPDLAAAPDGATPPPRPAPGTTR
jgi:hypothetical protein